MRAGALASTIGSMFRAPTERMTMSQIELSAGTIEYEDTGGEGPTLVLLHGLLMDASLWDDVIADQEAGLVGRTRSDADLRVVYAQLTDSGATRLEAASCTYVGAIS